MTFGTKKIISAGKPKKMPIIKSAIKRMRQTARRTKRNRISSNRYRELTKLFLEKIEKSDFAGAEKMFSSVQKAIDLAAKKHILHQNNAGRKKSRLAKMLHQKSEKTEKAAPAKAKSAVGKTKKEAKS